jgi:hypothetical protein
MSIVPQVSQNDFFISYNKTDRQRAEWIAWQLEDANFTTVLQAWDFGPANNFVLRMDEASKESARTIALLSPSYLRSGFTQAEWTATFKQDPTGSKGLLLPVRVRKCQPEGLLGPIVYIDLVGLDEQTARERLLAGVQRGRTKPKTPPTFPGFPSR